MEWMMYFYGCRSRFSRVCLTFGPCRTRFLPLPDCAAFIFSRNGDPLRRLPYQTKTQSKRGLGSPRRPTWTTSFPLTPCDRANRPNLGTRFRDGRGFATKDNPWISGLVENYFSPGSIVLGFEQTNPLIKM
jgi:hypothetical protein